MISVWIGPFYAWEVVHCYWGYARESTAVCMDEPGVHAKVVIDIKESSFKETAQVLLLLILEVYLTNTNSEFV